MHTMCVDPHTSIHGLRRFNRCIFHTLKEVPSWLASSEMHAIFFSTPDIRDPVHLRLKFCLCDHQRPITRLTHLLYLLWKASDRRSLGERTLEESNTTTPQWLPGALPRQPFWRSSRRRHRGRSPSAPDTAQKENWRLKFLAAASLPWQSKAGGTAEKSSPKRQGSNSSSGHRLNSTMTKAMSFPSLVGSDFKLT